MRKIVVMVAMIFTTVVSYSQLIESNVYDKFDSVCTIKTETDFLFGTPLRESYLSFCAKKTYYMQKDFEELENKRVYISFFLKITSFTTIDNGNEVKLQFEDGSIGTYKNVAMYHMYNNNDIAFVAFRVNPEEKIYRLPVKSVRVITTNGYYDFDIDGKNKSKIKDALSVLKVADFVRND